MAQLDEGFDRCVFVNCPFDAEYRPLLQPLLFAIAALGFRPRIASERSDSGEQRILKICELIAASRYSIHDLSRLSARSAGDFYRLNMPFELGVDYGFRRLGGRRMAGKRFLILSTGRYDYMKALSDLSGVDIEAHDDQARILVRKTRNWLVSTAGTRAPGASDLWNEYGWFEADLFTRLKDEGFDDEDIDELPIVEYLSYVERWLAAS